MLEFLCPTCGKRVQGDDSFAGKTVVCPGCNATITAPGAADPAGNTAIAEGAYPPPRDSADFNFKESPPLRSVRKELPNIFGRWVPYLVVAALGITAIGLLIPKLQVVRNGDGGARTQAINNLRQITLAMMGFHDANKRLPFNGTIAAAPADEKSGSWAFQILPYIDQGALFNKPNATTGVQAYVCPGRGRQSFCTTGAWTDYCINPWLNDPINGAANAPDIKRTYIDLTDGTSFTIFAGQGNIDPALYGAAAAIPQSTDIFKGGDPALVRTLTTNQPDEKAQGALTWGGPFRHGCLMAMGDGTVRNFPYSITGGVIRNGVADGGLAPFLTPKGGENTELPD